MPSRNPSRSDDQPQSTQFTEPVLRDRNGDTSKDWYVEFYECRDGTKRRRQVKSHPSLKSSFPKQGNQITKKQSRYRYFNKLLILIRDDLSTQTDTRDMRKLTIREAITLSLEASKKQVSHRSQKQYQAQADKFLRWCSRKAIDQQPVRSVRRELIDSYLDDIGTRSVGTLAYRFKWMVAKGMIPSDPTTGTERRDRRSKHRHKIYSPTETTRIFQQLHDAEHQHSDGRRYRGIYLCGLLQYYCMVRPVEVTRLRREDFNTKKRRVKVTADANHKSKRTRLIPISQRIIDELQRLPDLPNSGLLFPDTIDEHFSNVWQRLKRRKLVTPPDGRTFYSLKHTGAVRLYEKTRDVLLVMRYCGHSNLSTTMRYLREAGVDFHENENEVPDY